MRSINKDSAVQVFYDNNKWMEDTDLWYYLEVLEPKSIESFHTVLYNTALVLHDVYQKCSYYKYSAIEQPILHLMNVMVEEMSKKIEKNKENTTYLDKKLLTYNPENRSSITRYIDKIEEPVITDEDKEKAHIVQIVPMIPDTVPVGYVYE